MGSGDFSTDVSLGVLTPAASVRPVGSNSHNQDAPPQARRQAPDEQASEEQASDEQASEDRSTESDASSEHQLDRLA